VTLAVFHLFSGITQQQITQWDEARQIASALEMLKNQRWIVTTYLGETDYWNVKPPLSVWATALSYSLIDPPLLALRLPSLIAAMLTTLLVFLYACRWAGFYAGLLASIFFLTAWPIFTLHAARTADPDMLFILFVTLAWFLFARHQRSALAWAYVCLGFAFLAKSFHVAPYALAAFLYGAHLYRRGQLGLPDVVRLPCFFLLPVLPWAITRYCIDGAHFFEVMLFFDVIERSMHRIAGIRGSEPSLNYSYVLFCCGIWFWGFIALLAMTINRCATPLRDSRLLLPMLWTLLPLAVYWIAATKLEWYIYAILPPLVVVCAVLIVQAWAKLPRFRVAVISILLASSFAVQESVMIDYVTKGVFAKDEVIEALVKLSATIPGHQFTVYMETGNSILHPYEHHYATALLLKNIQIAKGGRAAFLQTKINDDVFFIKSNGQIIARRTQQ
jgi:4-amino-4-deoxy-L-arabinose transferase-like glycosyltransferase